MKFFCVFRYFLQFVLFYYSNPQIFGVVLQKKSSGQPFSELIRRRPFPSFVSYCMHVHWKFDVFSEIAFLLTAIAGKSKNTGILYTLL